MWSKISITIRVNSRYTPQSQVVPRVICQYGTRLFRGSRALNDMRVTTSGWPHVSKIAVTGLVISRTSWDFKNREWPRKDSIGITLSCVCVNALSKHSARKSYLIPIGPSWTKSLYAPNPTYITWSVQFQFSCKTPSSLTASSFSLSFGNAKFFILRDFCQADMFA